MKKFMLSLLGIFVICSPIVLLMTCLAYATTPTPDSTFDVLLLKYPGKNWEKLDIQGILTQATKQFKVTRSIIYPDDYVPVIIPREELQRVSNLLGDNRVLILSPQIAHPSEQKGK